MFNSIYTTLLSAIIAWQSSHDVKYTSIYKNTFLIKEDKEIIQSKACNNNNNNNNNNIM
jgi:hypothetical protein